MLYKNRIVRILEAFILVLAFVFPYLVQGQGLVKFNNSWSSPYRVDPVYKHHFVNQEGKHLYLLNKTAWAYFACKNPEQVLQKAKKQGVNVIRVCLEGAPYFDVLKMDMWPWGGTRAQPDFKTFNQAYWKQVEDRIRLAGEQGIGLDIVLYFSYHPTLADVNQQKPYWEQTIKRLGKYSNVLIWEIANEYIANEAFQDKAGQYFKANDPYKRAVCSSDGTTDDALWPHKTWMDLALVHTCTGNQPQYDLEHWYLNVARNTRQYGKPAFNNETGREIRHKNDDPVHRRKQAWLWTTTGAFWTWHSWEGCEGIDDPQYYGPGWEYLKPMADYYRSLPFWKLENNYTVAAPDDKELVYTALAAPGREVSLLYCSTRETGKKVANVKMAGRLKNGQYTVSFLNPATMQPIEKSVIDSKGLSKPYELKLPDFTDDLLVEIKLVGAEKKSLIEGTL